MIRMGAVSGRKQSSGEDGTNSKLVHSLEEGDSEKVGGGVAKDISTRGEFVHCRSIYTRVACRC